MILIVYFLFEGFYKLLFIPEAPATLAPVLPGIHIPGSPIFVPFWYGITALFIVVTIHEFSHGIVSAAHKIRVKNSGIVFFGPLIGAFVEPDEKNLKKKNWWVQESIFAAGPVSNALLSLIIAPILIFLLFPTISNMMIPTGFFFEEVSDGFPAMEAGVKSKIIYTAVNGEIVNNASFLDNLLQEVKPGDEISISNENLTHIIHTTTHPENPEKAYLGIVGLQTQSELKNQNNKWFVDLLVIIAKFLQWVFILSIGIGLANLLPLGPVDGGRMLLLSFNKWFGEKRSRVLFSRISIFFLSMIIILVFVPILKAIL
jgi:hypothetical protein